MSEKPKSAIELAMARLAAADREAGVVETPLTDEQRERIAECRNLAASRFAESEILFQDRRKRVQDPAALDKLEEEYRIDRERIESERDSRIERIRAGR